MTLTLQKNTVETITLGDRTALAGKRLTLDGASLRKELLTKDPRLTEVRINLAHPQESTRIVCVKDVIQPRSKISGNETGTGVLCVLEGMAVITCGPIVGFQEGIIDMSGPGADHTPFSSMPLVVLQLDVRDGLSGREHEAAVRIAGLRAAELIAEACREVEPDTVDEIKRNTLTEDLPRIAYIYMVLSQGLLHDTYVLGRDAKDGLPVVIEPEAIYDNGIVSGNCVSACDKNTTYHHQNNPIIAQLLRGHGTRWDFAGVVVTNTLIRLEDKQNSAATAIDLAVGLGADGAIVSKEGFGNPDPDLMLILGGLERAGVKAVALTDEFAGNDGGSQSLADSVPEANAIVSTGNANEKITLPAMATTIGPLPDLPRLAGGYPNTLHDDGTIEVELQAIIGATNELGFNRLSCREV